MPFEYNKPYHPDTDPGVQHHRKILQYANLNTPPQPATKDMKDFPRIDNAHRVPSLVEVAGMHPAFYGRRENMQQPLQMGTCFMAIEEGTGKIIIGKRGTDTHATGDWALPGPPSGFLTGGKADYYKDGRPEIAAAREFIGETGIWLTGFELNKEGRVVVDPHTIDEFLKNCIQVGAFADPFAWEKKGKPKYFIAVFVACTIPQGCRPETTEPTKCQGWKFMTWEHTCKILEHQLHGRANVRFFQPMFSLLNQCRELYGAGVMPPWWEKLMKGKPMANSAPESEINRIELPHIPVLARLFVFTVRIGRYSGDSDLEVLVRRTPDHGKLQVHRAGSMEFPNDYVDANKDYGTAEHPGDFYFGGTVSRILEEQVGMGQLDHQVNPHFSYVTGDFFPSTRQLETFVEKKYVKKYGQEVADRKHGLDIATVFKVVVLKGSSAHIFGEGVNGREDFNDNEWNWITRAQFDANVNAAWKYLRPPRPGRSFEEPSNATGLLALPIINLMYENKDVVNECLDEIQGKIKGFSWGV
ncbi:hypothetical protein T439DRAFT_359524 [Meredithblackwellia eburnea MCA 4105]